MRSSGTSIERQFCVLWDCRPPAPTSEMEFSVCLGPCGLVWLRTLASDVHLH